jgi:hypothetical protein
MLTVSSLLLATAASGSAATTVVATADSPGSHTFGPIVVGMPDLNLPSAKRAGGVDLYLRSGTTQRVTERALGLVGSGKGDFRRFGASAVVAHLNGDKYPDLVVGAPGLPAKAVKGTVVLLFGSAKGVTAKGAQVLSAGEAGDEFGTSLVLRKGVLYVGAPGHDSGGAANTGGLYRYSIGSKGKARAIDLLTQSLPALGGVVQADQRFGEVLAAGDDTVVIGMPNAVVGSAVGAGAMIRFHPGASNATFTAEIWTQDSPGVPDTAEPGDHFGAAVTADGYAVGVPGEDVGSIVDAGAVQTFIGDPRPDGPVKPVFRANLLVTQGDANVPGHAEAGDRFGAALSSGIFDCEEAISMAIGAPGEDVGAVTDAGSVTFVGLPPYVGQEIFSCRSQTKRQGLGLPGTPEPGDELGASLGRISGNPARAELLFDTLLIGVPGEDVGTTKAHRNTGRAVARTELPSDTQVFGSLNGDLPALRYGSVFAAEAH